MPSSNVTMLNAEQHLRTEVTHSAEFFPEDNANSRVYSARMGIPGFYVVDINPTESVYFKTEVFVRNDNGRRVFNVATGVFVMMAHARRHLLQAEQVKARAEFPLA